MGLSDPMALRGSGLCDVELDPVVSARRTGPVSPEVTNPDDRASYTRKMLRASAGLSFVLDDLKYTAGMSIKRSMQVGPSNNTTRDQTLRHVQKHRYQRTCCTDKCGRHPRSASTCYAQ